MECQNTAARRSFALPQPALLIHGKSRGTFSPVQLELNPSYAHTNTYAHKYHIKTHTYCAAMQKKQIRSRPTRMQSKTHTNSSCSSTKKKPLAYMLPTTLHLGTTTENARCVQSSSAHRMPNQQYTTVLRVNNTKIPSPAHLAKHHITWKSLPSNQHGKIIMLQQWSRQRDFILLSLPCGMPNTAAR